MNTSIIFDLIVFLVVALLIYTIVVLLGVLKHIGVKRITDISKEGIQHLAKESNSYSPDPKAPIMNQRWPYFIALPFLLFVGIGILLERARFEYMHGYITACGTLLSALIAIYISQTKEYLDTKRLKEGKKVLLEHLVTIVSEGAKSLKLEIQNYETFVRTLKARGMGKSPLRDTPLYFLQSASKEFNDRLFAAIVDIESKGDSDPKKRYLKIVSGVNNALFLCENAHSQYERFISGYNEQATKLMGVWNEFNALYQAIMNTQGVPAHFSQHFASIIGSFNHSVSSSKVNFYLIDAHRQHVLNPLYLLLQSQNPAFQFYGPLLEVLQAYEVVLNKIEEIQADTIDHFEAAIENLEEIETELNTEVSVVAAL